MRTDALDFDLPPDRIATRPVEPRDAARLMVCRRDTGDASHHAVRDLPDLGLFGAGDLMLVNNSKVLPAAFEGTRDATDGRVRGLYLDGEGDTLRLMLETRGTLDAGETIRLDDEHHFSLTDSLGSGLWRATLHGPLALPALLDRVGKMPLPPYIRKARRAMGRDEFDPHDAEDYNTVYADRHGSVAAPTAGLHFTAPLLERLDGAGIRRAAVTLHVGLGTFAPVRCDDLGDHPMHPEWIDIPPETVARLHAIRDAGGKTLVVGTTAVRAVESLPPDADHYTGQTNLYIRPDSGFTFRYTDMLLTNFHLPRSTLLAMVAALPGVGIDRLLGWYREAIDAGYRFYSYGDAMLIV